MMRKKYEFGQIKSKQKSMPIMVLSTETKFEIPDNFLGPCQTVVMENFPKIFES